MDESNKNVKNKIGVICTPDYRQLLRKRSYFEIPKQSGVLVVPGIAESSEGFETGLLYKLTARDGA